MLVGFPRALTLSFYIIERKAGEREKKNRKGKESEGDVVKKSCIFKKSVKQLRGVLRSHKRIKKGNADSLVKYCIGYIPISLLHSDDCSRHSYCTIHIPFAYKCNYLQAEDTSLNL